MPTEDRDDILEEESEFVEILENEMAISSFKTYELLLDDYLLEIKRRCDEWCDQESNRVSILTAHKTNPGANQVTKVK